MFQRFVSNYKHHEIIMQIIVEYAVVAQFLTTP